MAPLGIFPNGRVALPPIAAGSSLFYYHWMNKHVPLDSKLSVLQETDTYRKWESLDDQRLCIICERLITGRMIDVWESRRGVYHLHCPTPGCGSKPRDWFYHGAPRAGKRRGVQAYTPALDFSFRSQSAA